MLILQQSRLFLFDELVFELKLFVKTRYLVLVLQDFVLCQVKLPRASLDTSSQLMYLDTHGLAINLADVVFIIQHSHFVEKLRYLVVSFGLHTLDQFFILLLHFMQSGLKL